jgi:transposase
VSQPEELQQEQFWEGGVVDAPPAAEPEAVSGLRFKAIDRQQMTWAAIDVDGLIGPDHLARAIWDLVQRLDLSAFCALSKAREGQAGCSPYDPRLLASLWILAYSDSVSSAREIERLLQHHPAYRWLSGMAEINHHTLSDFRVQHGAALAELFAQVLAVLNQEGMIRLECIMQDGTKIQAVASADSMHREETLQHHLEAARERVRQLEQAEQSGDTQSSARQRAAQQRAAHEKVQRMERGLEELEKVRLEESSKDKKHRKDPAQLRVSESEPEVRKMKQARTGGYIAGYNLQLMTDPTTGLIVGMELVQAQADQGQLESGLRQVQQQTGVLPPQAVVDGGYLSRATVIEMDKCGVDLISVGQLDGGMHQARHEQSWKEKGISEAFYPSAFAYDAEHDLYLCPAGQPLHHQANKHDRPGVERHAYGASAKQCRQCPHQPQCCPVKEGKRVKGRTLMRTQNEPAVTAFVEKMQTPEAQAIYRQRKQTAEFPNLWIKEKIGLRRFRVRGRAKASCEALWAIVTFDLQQWWRLRWKPNLAAKLAVA